jgi:predicted transcriptional regulator
VRQIVSQSPIKVSEAAKDRLHYIAALTDATQAEAAGRAAGEYAARHADTIQAGLERARSVLAGGETAIAAHLLGVPAGDIERVAAKRHGC